MGAVLMPMPPEITRVAVASGFPTRGCSDLEAISVFWIRESPQQLK
jgi:hypothetical protein